MTYDSRPDTELHIERVGVLMEEVCHNLDERLTFHDESKLQEPEKSAFDRLTPRLKALTYGSEEYKASLDELGDALKHHYAENSHHPEHYPEGIAGMSLLDLIEMLCDWKAAGERHADGSMAASLEKNQARFGIGTQLQAILENTARELGWVD